MFVPVWVVWVAGAAVAVVLAPRAFAILCLVAGWVRSELRAELGVNPRREADRRAVAAAAADWAERRP